jgi:hypothetical protein
VISTATSTTPQFRQLDANLGYALEMANAGPVLNIKREQDLYRAAWIQAVAALDHWVHLELYQRATEIAMDSNAGRSNRFKSFEIPWGRVEEINNQNRPLREVFREALEDHYGFQSFQSTKYIGMALSLLLVDINTNTMWQRAANYLDDPARYPGMTKAELFTRHDGVIVKRRNEISHASDIDPVTKQRRPISHAETIETIRWVRHFAEAIISALR